MSKLVKRKIGGLVGVIMNSRKDDNRRNSYIYDVAFGFLTTQDAKVGRGSSNTWTQVHSDHVEFIKNI